MAKVKKPQRTKASKTKQHVKSCGSLARVRFAKASKRNGILKKTKGILKKTTENFKPRHNKVKFCPYVMVKNEQNKMYWIQLNSSFYVV